LALNNNLSFIHLLFLKYNYFTICMLKRRMMACNISIHQKLKIIRYFPFYLSIIHFIIYLVLNKGNLHIWYWKNITTVFVCRDLYRYHHPFIIPLKLILITWLKVHNTEQDFLMFCPQYLTRRVGRKTLIILLLFSCLSIW
jgi:hypothetical protein